MFKGEFYGDIDNKYILSGCYVITTTTEFVHNSFPNNFSPWYGLFVQFRPLQTQLIISGGTGQLAFRRLAGSPASWSVWTVK
jgi:hypothetical protein